MGTTVVCDGLEDTGVPGQGGGFKDGSEKTGGNQERNRHVVGIGMGKAGKKGDKIV